MSPDPNGARTRVDEAEREVLLEFYGFVREEILSESALHNKRIIQGLAVIGATVGYGVLRESLWVVAITPFVLGAILLQTAVSVSIVAKDAAQLIEIESRLQSISDVALWETRYGGYYGSETAGTGSLLDLNRLPGVSLLLLAVVAYVILARFGLFFWEVSPDELRIVATDDLLWAYVVFGAFVGGIGLSSLRYYWKMDPHGEAQVEDDRPAGSAGSGESHDGGG